MTTARDVIAKAFEGIVYDFHSNVAADIITNALLSAPESVRLELAAALNPWRPIETAPIGPRILGLVPIKNHRLIIVLLTKGGLWLDEQLHPMPYLPTHWLPLPAPPSEDKA